MIAGLTMIGLVGCAPSADTVDPTVSATAAETATKTKSPTPTPTPVDPAVEAVQNMTVAQQAASVVMGHLTTTNSAKARAYMSSGLGGFLLMGDNIPGSADQLARLTRGLAVDPELPPLIAIDEEGGDVKRLPWDDLPGADVLKERPASDTRVAFSARADLLRAAGINTNFGIVADVPLDTASFIHSRALGTDPASSAQRVVAATEGEQGTVLSTLKHFPGHGAAPGDSHHLIPTTDETKAQWRAGDAKPFEAGIDAGAELLMFGHLSYTAVDKAPASLSARWHEIARDELDFDGVMITDDLAMLQDSGLAEYRDPVRNAVRSLAAGNDMVLIVAGADANTARNVAAGIAKAVANRTLPAERLQDAAVHVMTARMQLADQ